eukprot:NODE_807_length_3783_cov_0.538002.p5 type:complete len:159 gc:universal NODE_807_length_3783_cov_0.538002:2050-1574(-)
MYLDLVPFPISLLLFDPWIDFHIDLDDYIPVDQVVPYVDPVVQIVHKFDCIDHFEHILVVLAVDQFDDLVDCKFDHLDVPVVDYGVPFPISLVLFELQMVLNVHLEPFDPVVHIEHLDAFDQSGVFDDQSCVFDQVDGFVAVQIHMYLVEDDSFPISL